jgi:hypothetical protein
VAPYGKRISSTRLAIGMLALVINARTEDEKVYFESFPAVEP